MFLSRVSRLFQVQAARARRWALDWTRTQGARFRVSVERRAPNRQDRFLSLAAPTQYRRSYTLCTTGIGAKTASDDSLTLQIWGILAFSLFTQSSDNVEDEEKKKEDDIILLLKRAKLSIMQGELEAANRILHQAIRLAHQAKNTQAITYTYSMAEKLFKAAMSFLLASGAQEDDNAVIEMSLKLASIYASQNKPELAEHGFEFCAESLEAKIEKQKDLPEGTLPEEERSNTRLLLGLCLDSYARYLTTKHQLDQAHQKYLRALQICREEQGEAHPQTVVLMNDLATVLDLQGRHQEAMEQMSQALELAKKAEHPDQHVLLCNMAGILLHQGQLVQARHVYREALLLAQATGDSEAMQQIRDGLEKLSNRERDEERETA
ncbi:tetratricopeptide repeat protein 19, mitochondrial isoform X2 [Lepisosteus oculatus]|uniref:tetratricopeptide repeat protein 19, mitochondrial isoform X2 n=1 Tax=Lepisosteus oculatus TaxID=7918 RepID=UPI0037210E2B